MNDSTAKALVTAMTYRPAARPNPMVTYQAMLTGAVVAALIALSLVLLFA